MKPIIQKLGLLVAMLLAVLPVSAQTFFKYQGLTYQGEGGVCVLALCPKDTTGTIVIPEEVLHDGQTFKVKAIADRTFYSCGKVTDIVIPNTVGTIGMQTFNSCSELKSIKLPDSLTKIGFGAFYFCTSLTALDIPDSVTTIEGGAFTGCSSLTSVRLPVSLNVVEEALFAGCSSLKTVLIPESVTKIGRLAFSRCESLETIDLPSGVTETGEAAFCDCKSLESVRLNNSITSISQELFAGCSSLDSINIPESVTEIGLAAFSDCKSLKSVWLKNNLTLIGPSAFFKCSSLTSIEIPESVTEIGESAFASCSSLEYIVLPDSISEIQSNTFSECKKLNSIQIPNSVKKIGESAFYYCSSLKDVSIPASVMEIGNSAFFLVRVNSLSFDESDEVIEINPYAFQYNTIQSLSMGRNLKFLDSENPVFEALEVLEIGDNVDSTDLLCGTGIKKLYFGENIVCNDSTIASQLALEAVYVKEAVPTFFPTFTEYQYANTVLFVPVGSFEAYRKAESWCNFLNIIETDEYAGISDVNMDMDVDGKEETGRYDLYGRRVGANYKGITIVRYTDGTSRKIMTR